MRKHVLRVTIKDCEVQTFSAGGKGGQNQNKRSSGVRVIHHPSGARSESREHRDQLSNKRSAFRRMAESPAFQAWVNIQVAGKPAVAVNSDADIEVEYRVNGQWQKQN